MLSQGAPGKLLSDGFLLHASSLFFSTKARKPVQGPHTGGQPEGWGAGKRPLCPLNLGKHTATSDLGLSPTKLITSHALVGLSPPAHADWWSLFGH